MLSPSLTLQDTHSLGAKVSFARNFNFKELILQKLPGSFTDISENIKASGSLFSHLRPEGSAYTLLLWPQTLWHLWTSEPHPEHNI